MPVPELRPARPEMTGGPFGLLMPRRDRHGIVRGFDLVNPSGLRAVRLRMQRRVWLAREAVMMPGTGSDAEYKQQRAREQRVHADQPDER
jgi:hypothetical protein